MPFKDGLFSAPIVHTCVNSLPSGRLPYPESLGPISHHTHQKPKDTLLSMRFLGVIETSFRHLLGNAHPMDCII
jgi:hypothetical protein